MRTVAVILAGGLASRMGGADKPLLELGGEPILRGIIGRLSGQVAEIAINANGDAARFSMFGLPVLPDTIAGYPGPLAGVLAGLSWARTLEADALLTLAGDTPFFPLDLAERLASAFAPDTVAVAASAGRLHPTIALWPTGLADDLRRHLQSGGTRKVVDYLARHAVVAIDFAAVSLPGGMVDPFFNINTPDDLEEARRMIADDRR